MKIFFFFFSTKVRTFVTVDTLIEYPIVILRYTIVNTNVILLGIKFITRVMCLYDIRKLKRSLKFVINVIPSMRFYETYEYLLSNSSFLNIFKEIGLYTDLFFDVRVGKTWNPIYISFSLFKFVTIMYKLFRLFFNSICYVNKSPIVFIVWNSNENHTIKDKPKNKWFCRVNGFIKNKHTIQFFLL